MPKRCRQLTAHALGHRRRQLGGRRRGLCQGDDLTAVTQLLDPKFVELGPDTLGQPR